VINEKCTEVKTNKLGDIVVKLPLPPSYGIPFKYVEEFKKDYFSKAPGFYFTGDSGF